MTDHKKPCEEANEELAQLQRRIGELEAQLARSQQAEDELRRSEATWRSAVSNAPVQVTTVDSAGTILAINRPVPGLTLENVVGTSVF